MTFLNKTKVLVLLFLSVIFVNVSTPAIASSTPSSYLTEILKSMRTIEADFTQTITDKNGKAVQQSTGRMYLQRPSQFRWEVLKPVPQLIVTNGVRLWVYDPDLEQVTIRKLSRAAGETPALLLTNEDLTLGSEFTVSAIQVADSPLQWFHLIPKDKSSMIASLKLGFSLDHVLREMRLEDHLGHTTRIQFKKVKLNSPIPAALFLFKAPAGVDVIDETKR